MNTEIYVKVGEVTSVVSNSEQTNRRSLSERTELLNRSIVNDNYNYIISSNFTKIVYDDMNINNASDFNIQDKFKARNILSGKPSEIIDYYTDMNNFSIFATKDIISVVDNYTNNTIISHNIVYEISCISQGLGCPNLYVGSDKLVKYTSDFSIIDPSFNVIQTDGIINTIAYDNDSNCLLVGGLFTDVNGITVNNIFKCDVNGVIDTSFSSINNGSNGEIVQISYKHTLTSGKNIVIVGNFTEFDGVESNRIVSLNDMYVRNNYTSTGFKTLSITQDVNDKIFTKKCYSDELIQNYNNENILIGVNYIDSLLYDDQVVKKMLYINVITGELVDDLSNSNIIKYENQHIDKLSFIKTFYDNKSYICANVYDSYYGAYLLRYDVDTKQCEIIYNSIDNDSYYYIDRIIINDIPNSITSTSDYIIGKYDKIYGVDSGVDIDFYFRSNALVRLNEAEEIEYTDNILVKGSSDILYYLIDQLGRKYILYSTNISGIYTYNGVVVKQLFRLLSDGTVDSSFNFNVPSFSLSNLSKMILDRYNINKLYLSSGSGLMIRLNNNGTLDSSFSYIPVGNYNLFNMLSLTNGKIIIAYYDTFNNSTKIKMINNNGSVNIGFTTITIINGVVSNDFSDYVLHHSNNEDLFILTGSFNYANFFLYRGVVSFDINGNLMTTFKDINSSSFMFTGSNYYKGRRFYIKDNILYVIDNTSNNKTYRNIPYYGILKVNIYTGAIVGDISSQLFLLPELNIFSYELSNHTNISFEKICNNNFGQQRIYLKTATAINNIFSLIILDEYGNIIKINKSYSVKYFINDGLILASGFTLIVNDYINNTNIIGGVEYNKASSIVEANVFNICNLDHKGLLKTTFNQGNGFNGQVYSTKLMSNGIIVCVGNFSTYNGVSANRIAFLNSDGSLHTQSMINVGVGFVNPVYKVIERMDTNKLVIGGGFSQYKGVNRNRIIQLNLDGTVDTSITGITSGSDGDIWDIVHDLPNNKFYISGSMTQYNSTNRKGIACLTPNLALNSTFSVGTGFTGAVVPALPKACYAISTQTDGKVLVGHNFTTYNGVAIKSIIRLNTNGTIDTTFQTNIGTGPTGVYSIIKEIRVQTDGKILIGGNFQYFNGNIVSNMCRLLDTGIYDTTFNSNSLFSSINSNGYNIGIVQAMDIQSDGKILVGGSFLTSPATVHFNNGIQRINSDGSLDLSYGRVDLQFSNVSYSVYTEVNEIILNNTNNDTIVVGRFDKYYYTSPTNNTSGGIQVVNSNIYKKLDLFKDEDIIMNFILKDSNDMSKVFSTYSQTFTIPASDLNNEILTNYFNTALVRKSSISFDAKIYIRKSLFKIGTIQIISGNYEKNKLVSYTISFSTGIGQLLKLMGSDKLSDLSYDNIGFSYDKDWVYNQIQNGALSNDVQVPLISTDRVWGYNDGSLFDIKPGSGKSISFKELKPAIRFDSIMQSIINRYSLNIDCPLFSRDEYKKMYIWLNSLSSNKKKVVLPFGIYSNVANSYIFFKTNLIEDSIEVTLSSTNYNVNRRVTITTQLLGLVDNTTGDILSDTNITIYYVDRLTNTNLAVITARTDSSGTLEAHWSIPQPSVNKVYDIRFFAESSEVIKYNSFRVVGRVNDTAPIVQPLESAQQGMFYQPKFDIAGYLGDITVLDFFSSFFKMFNISVIENNITNKMTFLTQSELYIDTLDYTSYIDIKTHTIKPQPFYKTYDFKYLDCEYFRNYEFKKLVGLEYGELKYTRNDIGVVGDYIIEPKFSIMNYFYVKSNLGDLNVKTSYGFIGGADKDNTTQLYKPYNPKGLTLMYIEDKVNIMVGSTPTSINFNKSTGIANLSSYIRFGNQEDLINANNNNSLTFSTDVEDKYGSFDKNLFTNYYSSTIERIVNSNTRTYTIKAVLPTYEINRFSLRNIIIIRDKRYTVDSASINIITGETTLVITNIATSPIKYI